MDHSNCRVLHVEDNERDADLIEAALDRDGMAHESVRVFSRADFMVWIERGGFDLILCDYTLPGFSGIEALSIAREKLPEVPFIYVSGTMGEERAVEALRNGATDYVLKDRPAKLGPAVRRALREAAERAGREKAVLALRESEERYRNLVETAPDVIYSLTLEGQFESLNPAFDAITGWPRSEWIGRHFKDIIHADDLPKAMELFSKTLEGQLVAPFELRILSSHGDYLVGEFTTAKRVEGGEVKGVFGIARDITEYKRSQEQIAHLQKLEAVGRLAGGVAHDFNNILSVIISYAGFLLDGLPPESPQKADVLEVKKAGERAAALSRQLLAFSRRQTCEPRRVQVNEALSGLAKMLKRLIGEDIAFELDLQSDAGTVMIDPSQLEQIVVNLAINARDAMPSGGRLLIGTKGVVLDGEQAGFSPGAAPGPYTMISVTDSGTGIPQEIQDKIFEPFFTTKVMGKGTGLGLSVVFGAVKQNRGHIEFESEVGLGTTFRVFLPRVAGDSKDTGKDLSEPRGGGETILVVEDDEAVRRSLVRILDSAGYRVIEASSGEEAIERCEAAGDAVNLLLTDVVMPGMGGVSLASIVRERCPVVKVLFCSGYTDEMLSLDFMAVERPDLIQKPVDRAELLRKLRDMLEGKKA
jgi:PAS domain S-box-containing protein